MLEAADIPGGRVGEREVRAMGFNNNVRLVYPFSKPCNRLRGHCANRNGALHETVLPRVRELYPNFDAACGDRHEQWIARKLPLFYLGHAARLGAFRQRQ